MKASSGIRAQDGKKHKQSAPEKLKVGGKYELQVFGQSEHRWPLLIGGAKNP
jgi:hypothetical protein